MVQTGDCPGMKFWYLDGHASAVEALWEEHLLATKPVESCGKLQLQTGRNRYCHFHVCNASVQLSSSSHA